MDNPTLERWIDRSAFRSAPLGEFGNSGIGILRAPSFWNVDFTVGKRLATFGSHYMVIRGEFFNAFNHPNFGPPQANIQSTAFGTITSTGQRSACRAVGGEVRVLTPENFRRGSMDRREFLAAMATGPALAALQPRPVPQYRIVTNHKPAARPGMPGTYPGRVVTVHSPKVIDEVTEKVDVPTVQCDDRARDVDVDG